MPIFKGIEPPNNSKKNLNSSNMEKSDSNLSNSSNTFNEDSFFSEAQVEDYLKDFLKNSQNSNFINSNYF